MILSRLLAAASALLAAASLAAQSPDLTVAIAQPASPARYAVYETTVTVVNEGFAPATGVVVDVPRPEGVVYEGGNESSAPGRFTTFGERRGQWRVGSVAAQSRAVLTLRYYLLAPAAPVGYAQVLSQNEPDADSTPGNGTPPAVNEDDEASTALGTGDSGPPCEIASEILTVDCDDAGTPADPADDTYSVTFVVTNGDAAGEWLAEFATAVAARGTYGEPFTYRGGLIEVANRNRTLLDVRDALDRTCETTVNWRDRIPGPCSDGPAPAGADLSLALSRPGDPAPFTTYALTATVRNDGPAAATGVVVGVPFDQGTGAVFSGGNEFAASQGSYSPYGKQRWTVGTLAPGAEATLRLNLYRLRGELPARYAQVLASDVADPDSAPGNGTPPAVNEDDEASTDDAPVALADLTVSNLQVASASVAQDEFLEFSYDLTNVGTATAAGDFTVGAFLSTDDALSADDVESGSVFTGNIGADGRARAVTSSTEVDALAPGRYFLIVAADSDEAIAESDEANNLAVAPFTVAPAGEADGDIACTFSQPVDAEALPNFGAFRFVRETATGIEVSAVDGYGFRDIQQRRTTTLTFTPEGVQLGEASVSLVEDLGVVELASGPAGFTVSVTGAPSGDASVTLPSPFAGDDASRRSGTALGLPDGSGYFVAVSSSTPGSDIYEFASYVLDADLDVVSGPQRLADSPNDPGITDLADPRFAPSEEGNFFLGLQVGPYSRYLLVDGEDFGVLGEVELLTSGRVDQPIAFRELPDGTFAIASFFDGASDLLPNTVVVYSRDGEVVDRYSSAIPVCGPDVDTGGGNLGGCESRSVGNALLRPDGGFVGVSNRNSDGTEIEVLGAGGTPIAETFLPGITNVSLLDVAPDTSIYAFADRDGERVFLRLSPNGSLECEDDVAQGGADTYDLELSAVSARATPPRFAVNEVTYTVTNAGDRAFDGPIAVFIDLPQGTVYEGGNEFAATAGDFSPLPFGDGEWTFSGLPPGASESITVRYYAREAGGYVAYAEVVQAAPSTDMDDPDSTPANGDGATAREDDEVALDLRYGPSAARSSAALTALTALPGGDVVYATLRDLPTAQSAELVLADLTGRVLLRHTAELLVGETRVALPVPDLAPGIYLVGAPALDIPPAKLVIR